MIDDDRKSGRLSYTKTWRMSIINSSRVPLSGFQVPLGLIEGRFKVDMVIGTSWLCL